MTDTPTPWLPSDGPDGRPDPRWREHTPGDPMPCAEGEEVIFLTRTSRHAFEDRARAGLIDWTMKGYRVTFAWRPAAPLEARVSETPKNEHDAGDVLSAAPCELAAARAEAERLREAASALNALIENMQEEVRAYLPPDGIEADELINRLIYWLDGPQQRKAQRAYTALAPQQKEGGECG